MIIRRNEFFRIDQMNSYVSRLRQLLLKAMKDCKDGRDPIIEALQVLEELESVALLPAGQRVMRQRNAVTEYRVEQFGGREVLSEYRQGLRHPFRCDRAVYNAVVGALHGESQGIRYDDIVARVAKKLAEKTPDYLIRLCLRCWLKSQPRLIARGHTKYTAISPSKFRQAAAARWDELTSTK
jgi:hypothetical protein